MTRRQKIVALVLARLGTVSVANGYLTALGANVYLWRTTVIPAANAPVCIIRDRVNEHERGHKESLRFEFEVSCKESEGTNYTVVTNMIQDVEKALSTDTTIGSAIGKQCRWIPESEEVDVKLDGDEESAVGTVTMVLEHSFTEKWMLDGTVY